MLGVYRQKLESVPDGILVPAFPSVVEFIEAYQSVLAFPYIDTFTIIHRIEEEAAKKIIEEEEQNRAKNLKTEEGRSLWRRSIVR